MNHWGYISLAYGAFLFLLLWDFVAPRWALKHSIRNIYLNQRKRKSS